MISALILICTYIAAPEPAQCTEKTAERVIRPVGLFESGMQCGMHSMAFLAKVEDALQEGEYARIVCMKMVNPKEGIG